jgi:CBS domain-containing protein
MKLASLLDERLIVVTAEVSPLGDALEELLDRVLALDGVEAGRPGHVENLRPQIDRGGLSIGTKISLFHLTIPEIGDSRLAVKLMGGWSGSLLFLLSTPRTSPKFYLQVAAALRAVAANREGLRGIMSAGSGAALLERIDATGVALNPRIEVRNIMRKNPPSVRSDDPLSAVVERMVFRGTGGLAVTDGEGKVLGVITQPDLVRVFLPELMTTLGGSDRRDDEPGSPEDMGERFRVKDFMARSVLCVSEDAPITEVATLMINKKARRLPVVREGKLVGIISLEDIIREILRGWFV